MYHWPVIPGKDGCSSPDPSPSRPRAFIRLLHPFPSFLNAAVVAVFACVAVRGWPGIVTVASLSLTMLLIQFAIGALNDWADRHLDARTKPAKPIPSGLVSAPVALGTALLLGTASFALSLREGAAASLLAMTGLGIGAAYDLGLKRTPLSALTYALALPLVPVWVWTANGRLSGAIVAVAPLGMLLGFALQLANALPDDEGDRAAGLRGTVQWLGAVRARRLCWLLFVGSLLLALLLAPLVGLRAFPFAVCWAGAAALAAVAIALYRQRPGVRSLRTGWALLAPSAALVAVGWFASLP